MARKLTTRRNELCVQAEELPTSVLPTQYHVLAFYQYHRNELRNLPVIDKEPCTNEVIDLLLPNILDLRNKASIPIINEKKIKEKVRKLHDEYRNLMKSNKKTNFDLTFQRFAARKNVCYSVNAIVIHSRKSRKKRGLF